MYNYLLHLRTYLIIKKKELLNTIGSKNNQYTPFIILCEPRTGSTLLHTYLNFHPRIKSYGEVIREQIEKHHNGCLLVLENDIFTPHAQHLKAIGLKLFYYYYDHPSYANIFRQIVDRKEVKIIHLVRQDIFQLFVSLKVAQKTNMWSSSKPHSNRKQNIFVDPDEFRAFAETYLQRQHFFKNLFQAHEILSISYESLIKNKDRELEKIQHFLGVKPKSLQSLLQKQNPDNLESVVINYREVIESIEQVVEDLKII